MPDRVSKDEFIRIWQAAKSRSEVAARLGLDPESCTNRARNYRKKGVKLKQFPKHNHPEPPAQEAS